ncbi:MAG TPA: hypothetical protein VEW48_07850 [Thermoanaerobaculia bacterium]|nr:hypothetical protein [Thermoanaerobaculia bacterium]
MPPKTAERQLTTAKGQIMTADYRADLAGLKRLRGTVVPLTADPAWGYLAHYWAGFASWRLAINGASHGMSREDLRANLESAAADFEASIRLRDDFADSYAAAAGVNGWLAQFLDPAGRREGIERYQRLLARAKELEPDNPRMLWVEAVPYLYLPVDRGGDRARALKLYRRMVEVSGSPVASSPLPDWGKPEGLMSLAYAHLNQPAPDLESADKEAREALRLQPDWSYVKDILLPQIEKARTTK